MAQKSLKAQAARNTAKLNQTHLISLGVNLFFIVLRFAIFRQRSLYRYTILAFPSWVIEFWFERSGRPSYNNDGKDLRKAGEDLEAKGLTEWMWDVIYWTWGVTILATLAGDWAWWLYAVVPIYSAYLAITTFLGLRKGLGGMMGGAPADTSSTGQSQPQGQSKRAAKMEKRGGQRVQYR